MISQVVSFQLFICKKKRGVEDKIFLRLNQKAVFFNQQFLLEKLMILKLYFLIAGICLTLDACTTPQPKNRAVSQTTSTTDTAIATNEGPLETFMQGCKTELENYCKDVTPGEGRVIACIYAHEDKLSDRCENALYDSAQQLENAWQHLPISLPSV